MEYTGHRLERPTMNTALLCKNVLDVVPKGPPPTPTPVTTVVEKSQVIIVPDGSSIAEDTDVEENVATVPPEITVDTSLSEEDESVIISALNDVTTTMATAVETAQATVEYAVEESHEMSADDDLITEEKSDSMDVPGTSVLEKMQTSSASSTVTEELVIETATEANTAPMQVKNEEIEATESTADAENLADINRMRIDQLLDTLEEEGQEATTTAPKLGLFLSCNYFI